MPGDLLDLILLLLVAAFAVAGYRQGLIIGVLSLAGFVGGAAIGAAVAPRISTALKASLAWQAFIAILVIFIAAVIGMLITSGIGAAVRSRIRARPITFLDSLGGAVVNVIAVLVVAWMIGSFLADGPFPAIARQVNHSVVLRTVDRVVPRAVLGLPGFPPLRRLLASGTQVFDAIGAENALAVPPPDQSVLRSRGLARDRNSIVKIIGIAPSCSEKIEGSGFVFSPGYVLTNAHVVAGVTDGPRVTAPDGQQYAARVVLYNPNRDIAVLHVPGLTAAPLKFDYSGQYGASAIVAGYPLDHSFTAVAARIGHSETAVGENIYSTAQVQRQIYPVRAVVEHGNSGGPLLAPDGRVYGMVFAASTTDPDTGYALTASEVKPAVQAGVGRTQPVPTQSCVTP